MRFKIDENLPVEIRDLLREAGYDCLTVLDQEHGGASDDRLADICRRESRALITLDLDFADIRTYPPEHYCGIIVLRLPRQDKKYLLNMFPQILSLLDQQRLVKRLWIIEPERVRVRGGTSPDAV